MVDNDILRKIPDEMREAASGSFPVSPAVMDGHYAVADLYWDFRQDLLNNRTRVEIFGEENPVPPTLILPRGHIPLSNLQGVNTRVWDRFLEVAFKTRPVVNSVEKIRSLLTLNAAKDNEKFVERLSGQHSQITPDGKVAPSLVRAFVFEGRFPFGSNEFFQWMLGLMERQIVIAESNQFREKWSKELGNLFSIWHNYFPNIPFMSDILISTSSENIQTHPDTKEGTSLSENPTHLPEPSRNVLLSFLTRRRSHQ